MFDVKAGEIMRVNIKFSLVAILVIIICISISGCKSSGKTTNGQEMGGINKPTETTTVEDVRYNATDQVIMLNINTNKMEITVKSIGSDTKYTLTYSGGTRIRSKNDVELTMSQMQVGQIVDVYYVNGSQRLIEIKESTTAWKNDSVVKWKVDYERKIITIGSDSYRYEDTLFISSNGQQINIDEISDVDELIVRGIDSRIYSVVVGMGHGYVRLVDDTNMVDGIIEIGNKIMTVITKDMVLVAPEGTYTLTATKNGKGGSKEITVIRDEELIVSLSEFQQEATRYGSVNFNILPEDSEAVMYIDGEKKDYSDLVELSYGKHILKLESDKYNTYQKTITIASIYTNITVNMDGGEETTTDSEKTTTDGEKTTSNSSEEETTVSMGTGTYNNTVLIVAPSDATVYVDGVLKGKSPVSFSKTSGSHTILLMKNGYKSKVYTIDLDDTKEDVILSYPDMVKTDE